MNGLRPGRMNRGKNRTSKQINDNIMTESLKEGINIQSCMYSSVYLRGPTFVTFASLTLLP